MWIAKQFPFGAEWASDQDAFAALQMVVAAQGGDDYRKMVMALSSDNVTDTVFIGMPRSDLTSAFPDYLPVAGELPPMTTVLLGDQTEFHKHFDVRSFEG